MKKILFAFIFTGFISQAAALAMSPTFSSPTAGSIDLYPLIQHQAEKQETLDFVNDSANYKEKRKRQDEANEYRAGNRHFNPKFGSGLFKKKSMKFSKDSNGNIIIEDVQDKE